MNNIEYNQKINKLPNEVRELIKDLRWTVGYLKNKLYNMNILDGTLTTEQKNIAYELIREIGNIE